MAKRKLKEKAQNSHLMRVAAEFKILVKEKAERDGKEMTAITEEIARKMQKIL